MQTATATFEKALTIARSIHPRTRAKVCDGDPILCVGYRDQEDDRLEQALWAEFGDESYNIEVCGDVSGAGVSPWIPA